MGKEVSWVIGNDWEGLYVDGVLVTENHSLNPRDVLKALGVPFVQIICDQEWLEDQGSLPENVSEVRVKER